MPSLIISFLSGFIISMSGAIAPSNMSAVAMELTIDKSKKVGLWFALGSAIVEIIYIRLYFLGFDAFVKKNDLFVILQWIMIVLFFVIGISLFIKTYNEHHVTKKKKRDFSTYTGARAFFYGVLLKAINPLQFVFWTFWSTYLVSNAWLQPQPMHYNLFCIGLGLATFIGTALYVFLGNYLETKSFFSKKIFRRVIAVFLSLTSVVWAIKLLVRPEGLII
jgi:threonine/homoserine/homoserine lactone efflux protein